MRLIDADKIRYRDMSDGHVPNGVWYTFLDDVEKIPTVEAIPIRWIQHYTKEHSMYGAIDDVFVVLHTMLCEWERENETNRCE